MELIRVADAARAVDLKGSLFASAMVVLYYDYLLSLPDEVKLYWRRGAPKFSWGLLFFYLNRYTALLGHIPVAIEYYAQSLSVQKYVHFYHQLFAAMSTAIVTTLFILRTYALYERSHVILMVLLAVALTVLSVACWALLINQRSREQPDGVISSLGLCDLTLSTSDARFLAVAWSTVLVFDAIVFSLTIRQRSRSGRSRGDGLFALVVRDGTIYFGVLSVLYTIDILTFLLTNTVHKGIIVVYTNVFSSILMNRMMLNIRNPRNLSGPTSVTVATSIGVFSSVLFAREGHDAPPMASDADSRVAPSNAPNATATA
ncbi:hypothetical protein EIP91_005908 [Steccherinum ochraceum]|uniref:DUF6533 domain-containing protein n=1 Tax=Steccherinum ochraceum TaxID=92696 RepID=A0A4R0REW0_9APHY|nr:hypothetical protein EIP91_005908 [Steccherinum ochraceum]